MRLYNVNTGEFVIHNPQAPRYAIASHRWMDPETSFQEVAEGRNLYKPGYKKFEGFVKYVRVHLPDIEWLWIDTCCIDKTASNELMEAINLMFSWYKDAAVCLAYLPDVQRSSVDQLRGSEWFKRGWTLQELIAPRLVILLDEAWDVIGQKGDPTLVEHRPPLIMSQQLASNIASITGLPEAVLCNPGRIATYTDDEKLTWVQGRTTTKEEDLWYSLIGICDVALAINYGERGERAKWRLLEALRVEKRIKAAKVS